MFSKINEFLRHERKIRSKIKSQQETLHFLQKKYLRPYFEEKSLQFFNIKPKKDLSSKVVWQYWGQGLNNLRQPVDCCMKSVQSNLPDGYKYIVLTDKNVQEWLDIPSFVSERLNNGNGYSHTFYSDILRLALLNAYGGVWVDATILLTGQIPAKYLESSLFCFYRGAQPNYWKQWEIFNPMYFSWRKAFKVRMCNSFLISKPNHPIISALLDLLLNYWKCENNWKHYFIFQLLFDELIKKYLPNQDWTSENDLLCHELLFHCQQPFDINQWQLILEHSSIHKLTYYNDSDPSSFYSYILKEFKQIM